MSGLVRGNVVMIAVMENIEACLFENISGISMLHFLSIRASNNCIGKFRIPNTSSAEKASGITRTVNHSHGWS